MVGILHKPQLDPFTGSNVPNNEHSYLTFTLCNIHVTLTETAQQTCCDCISRHYVNIYPLQPQD